MSDDLDAITALARRFFDAIEAGDVAGVAACYADEVAIWHRALSAQEISRLSSATTPLSR